MKDIRGIESTAHELEAGESVVTFVYWLVGLSTLFVMLERLRPRYRQKIFRSGILTDLFYFVFNGHFLGWGLALVSVPVIAELKTVLQAAGWQDLFYLGVAQPLPPWLQFIVAFFLIDFSHWCIHNFLHRIPWLWSFHRVHHSIEIMDWIGSMRFHWVEAILYKSITYPLLSFFGFHTDILLVLAIINTGIGHFNHSNLRVGIGPLKYLFNNPTMHIWHHHRTPEGPIFCNFGINLSLWDWLFGTAYLPDQPPQRLGFDGIESFPSTAFGQVLYPLPVWRVVSPVKSAQSIKEKNEPS